MQTADGGQAPLTRKEFAKHNVLLFDD